MPLPDFHVSEPFTLGIELEMQVVNPPGYDLSQDSSMLIDAVKNKITAGEVKHDITESMLELATDVCRDINQAAGQFSAMQKVVLQAATDHHLEICGGGRTRFRNGSVRRYAITNAINARWKTLVISFSRRPFLVSMSMLAAPVAMTPFICCTACHDLCRTLSPFPPRRHICRERIRVLPPHDRIFFPPFLIMARCRGSVTGNNLKPYFAV